MSAVVRSADGGDRKNRPDSPRSRARGNLNARPEILDKSNLPKQKDLRITLEVQCIKHPSIFTDIESVKKRLQGRYICVRVETMLAVLIYDPYAVVADNRKPRCTKGKLLINVRISPKIYPRLYALLEPLSGRVRAEMLLDYANATLGRPYVR